MLDLSSKKNRTTLKGYFEAGDIPTQQDFADLIDGLLNHAEDGIAKVAGNPLSVQAEGDALSIQSLMDFYGAFTDANPAWRLSLNPRTNPNDPGSSHNGLTFSDGAGNHRLFIDATTGNLGVGTIQPQASVHAPAGGIFNGIALGVDPATSVNPSNAYETLSTVNPNHNLRLHSNRAIILHTNNDHTPAAMLHQNGNLGIGTGAATPVARLEVNGSVKIGGFATTDTDEWPNVTWLRDTGNNWDEGLIKGSSTRNAPSFGVAGFGIHIHQTRQFGIYSSGWRNLLAVKGNTGDVYVRGKVGIGTNDLDTGRLKISFNSSTPQPHILLEESGTNDYARLGFRTANVANKYWLIATRTNATDTSSLMNFYYHNGTTGRDWLRINGEGDMWVYGKIVQENWRGVSFLNGWQNYSSAYNTAGYYKDSMGIVHLRGLIKGGTIAHGNTGTAFILPAGYRPWRRELFCARSYLTTTNPTDNHLGRIDVLNNGRVNVVDGSNSWISLDGITFRAHN